MPEIIREKDFGVERLSVNPFTAAGKSQMQILVEVFLSSKDSVKTSVSFTGTPINGSLNAAEAASFIHHFTAITKMGKEIAAKMRAKKTPVKKPARKKA